MTSSTSHSLLVGDWVKFWEGMSTLIGRMCDWKEFDHSQLMAQNDLAARSNLAVQGNGQPVGSTSCILYRDIYVSKFAFLVI
jgi:hypothetical protein